SCAIGSSTAFLDVLENQIVLGQLVERFPFWCNWRPPLLTTHTTVPVDTFLYQIPTYRLLEFPGLKNPSSKFPPADKRVSPSFMDCPGVIVFSAKVLVVKKRSKHRKRTNKKASSILEIIDIGLY
ncbi:hypothetical protein ES319_D01G072400v1, partial [Gossypium barbadense]